MKGQVSSSCICGKKKLYSCTLNYNCCWCFINLIFMLQSNWLSIVFPFCLGVDWGGGGCLAVLQGGLVDGTATFAMIMSFSFTRQTRIAVRVLLPNAYQTHVLTAFYIHNSFYSCRWKNYYLRSYPVLLLALQRSLIFQINCSNLHKSTKIGTYVD